MQLCVGETDVVPSGAGGRLQMSWKQHHSPQEETDREPTRRGSEERCQEEGRRKQCEGEEEEEESEDG